MEQGEGGGGGREEEGGGRRRGEEGRRNEYIRGKSHTAVVSLSHTIPIDS